MTLTETNNHNTGIKKQNLRYKRGQVFNGHEWVNIYAEDYTHRIQPILRPVSDGFWSKLTTTINKLFKR